MAKSPSKKKNRAKKADSKQPRSLWKGSISFGLVSIPVALYSAEAKEKLSFRLLDRRDFTPVRYRRVNEKSGKDVPWDDIVKGYEYDKSEFVVLSDADFQRANVEASQTIAISEFVEAAEISPIYFDKPYYLAPLKHGEKGYALLREAMRRTGKAGIARMVLRSREYLTALVVHGNLLVANLLRFPHDLRAADGIDVPGKDFKQLKITDREISMAEELIDKMVDRWDPKEFHEEYFDDLMKIIDAKIKSGKTKTIDEPAHPAAPRSSKVVDITEMLKRSVKQAQQPVHRRKAG